MRPCAALAIAGLAATLLAAPATPSVAGTVDHEVRAGDNLHLLAGYYYKDPRAWKRIWRENRPRVRRASILAVGSVLRVPLDGDPAWDIPYEEFVARVRRGR